MDILSECLNTAPIKIDQFFNTSNISYTLTQAQEKLIMHIIYISGSFTPCTRPIVTLLQNINDSPIFIIYLPTRNWWATVTDHVICVIYPHAFGYGAAISE